jgi:hypothetical protein
VDEDHLLFAVESPDLDQLVDDAPSGLGLADDLGQLFVEALVAARPVDLAVDLGKGEGQELGEVDLEDLDGKIF